MTSRPPAEAIRRAVWAFVACLAPVTVGLLAGCSRSGAGTEEPAEPETVVVYPAQLMSEHPLYPETVQLSARLAALTPPADLQPVRALVGEPLRRRLLGPPKAQVPVAGALTAWEAEADAALAAQVQEAEEALGAWPQSELRKTEARQARETADAIREERNRAEMERLRIEIGGIERRRDELMELRRLAASEDREEATRALDRQAALWREITAQAEAAQREAEAKLRELQEAGEIAMSEALEAERRRAEAQRAAHVAGMTAAGEVVRERQAEGVAAATAMVTPEADAREVPPPPETTELTALLDRIEAAQRAARQRRISRLADARTSLQRQIALSTERAVRAVALRNGLNVRFVPEATTAERDATEDFRPLLREYWAARPAISAAEPGAPGHRVDREAPSGGARP